MVGAMKPESPLLHEDDQKRGPKAKTAKKRRSRLSLSEKLLSEAKLLAKSNSAAGTTGRVEQGGPFDGLPLKVKELFKEHRSIESLYAWQTECLSHPAVLNRRNLILSLPTSGGKTLIAEILILKQILVAKKDAILILPFVSIVHEKIKSFVPFGLALDFLVEEYAGSKGRFPPIKRRKKNSLYICTIEKSQSLVNSLIENQQINNLGLVVIDEVELKEYVKIGNSLVEVKPSSFSVETVYGEQRLLEPSTNPRDPDGLIDLVLEVIPQSSCLIFCSSKKSAQNVALLTARLLSRELKQHKTKEKLALLASLREDCENNLCPDLEKCIPYGVAYHHSGLTNEERKLIQDAFLDGTLCIIACTSTLAAGVNLPAKRVIIRTPYVGNSLLSRGQYKQMIGRAGRAGLDTHGESITILQRNNQPEFTKRLIAEFERCESKLITDNAKGIRSLLLSLFALKILNSIDGAKKFLKSTLLGVQSKELGIDMDTLGIIIKLRDRFSQGDPVVESSIEELLNKGLLRRTVGECSLETTALGNAAYKGPIDVEFVSQLYQDLVNSLKNGIVLATHLHLICCVVPYDCVSEIYPNWELFYKEFCSLTADERRVLELQGFNEGYIVHRLSGINSKVKSVEGKIIRLYLALILNHLWKRNRVWDVANMFGVPRGWVQNLLQSTSAFASCVSRFCEQIPELWPFQCLLPNFVKQLAHCKEMELLPLLDVEGVKQGRARQLYAAGYKSIVLLALAKPEELVKKIDHLSKRQARQIVASAKMLLEEERAAQIEQLAELFIPAGSTDNNEMLHSVFSAV